jgi:quercetin dioxygenase-like cupin family protein
MWGDANSGFVIDQVYVSSEHLHVLDFSLPPGGRFGHSPGNPTVFAADELLYVLEGELMLSDPSTGETQRVVAGEAVFFERDTWHHGRAGGSNGVRVLEFFSPTPTTGASSAYAKQQPYLDHTETVDARIFDRWPTNAASLRAEQRIIPIREHDLVWAQRDELEFAFYAATEHVTVTRSSLRPGASSVDEVHPGEEFVLVLDGDLMVMTPDAEAANCLLLAPGDAAVLPPGTRHSYLACGDDTARWLTGVGPGWTGVHDIWPDRSATA